MSTLERAVANGDLSRIPSPTEKDFARLREYRAVRALLLAADDPG